MIPKNNNKREPLKIAVLSGKGGVGKSMVSSSLVLFFAREGWQGKKISLTAVDADADAPNLDIWLGGVKKWEKIFPVVASEKPVIDYEKCDGCGQCAQHCPFGAIKMVNGRPVVNRFLCEGCGLCENICPRKAIHFEPVQTGDIRVSYLAEEVVLVSGQLRPGEAGSGKLVDAILKKAKEYGAQLMIIDAAPGTSCPVKAVLRETDFVVFVAEPSLTSFADLRRTLEVVDFFHLPYGLVLNKAGLNHKVEEKFISWAGKKFLGLVKYDRKISEFVSRFIPIVDSPLPAKKELHQIYENLSKTILSLKHS